MTVSKRVLFVPILLCVAPAWGQPMHRAPHIGYLYPSGGQLNTTFEILVGGQNLWKVSEAYVSGEGVHARVIQHYRPVVNLDKEQRQELQNRLREAFERELGKLSQQGRSLTPFGQEVLKGWGAARKHKPAQKGKVPETQEVTVPEHPLLRDLDKKNLRELLHIRNEFFVFGKRQPNAQIAESVLLEITIDPKAAAGDREIRLKTPLGLTNPMCFQIGLLPESHELEPNDPGTQSLLEDEPAPELPILLNGQIKPGDVDCFRFRARQGQQLVIEAEARHLIPYLADAVPGWFQATLALYDDNDNELAFTDDYRFDPDPVLFYEIPEDGEYRVEIRDSIYRGREDFVYRIAVGEQPFITEAFPLGGRSGAKMTTAIDGWNLRQRRLALDTGSGADAVRQTTLRQRKQLSNPVAYAVDTLPEALEKEPNDTPDTAQSVPLPRIINGRIAQPGDVDVFQFRGRAGDDIVAEVFGRRLYSPLDSLVRLTDGSGRVLQWNDDYEDKGSGLTTHHADSYLHVQLPDSGVYYVHVADSQNHGSDAHAYRLRIGPARPDFALRVTPSSINAPTGGTAVIHAHALRKDGFNGDIELVLKDAPVGFSIGGGRIPAGCDHVPMTLTLPRHPLDEPVVLQLEGRASIDGKTVTRPVIPAEDMMQAFLYTHLVPSQELMVAGMGKGSGPVIELAGDDPIEVPKSGTAQVRIKTIQRPMLRDITLELREPPDGVTLGDVRLVPGGLAFVLKADGEKAQVGLAGNLIVEAFAKNPGKQKDGKARGQNQRFSLGLLPAVPFEIVQP